MTTQLHRSGHQENTKTTSETGPRVISGGRRSRRRRYAIVVGAGAGVFGLIVLSRVIRRSRTSREPGRIVRTARAAPAALLVIQLMEELRKARTPATCG